MTIYLYVKTHNVTGLKYLGKTVRKDWDKYTGSGKRWRHHIRKHGYDVTTEIIRECQNVDELREWGVHYSRLWNVVDSDEWANLKEECGDGWSSEDAKVWSSVGGLAASALGKNHWQTERNPSKLLVAQNLHHFQTNNPNYRRVAENTHHLLSGQIQKRQQLKMVESGQHNSHIQMSCLCCRNTIDTINFVRWHGDKCGGAWVVNGVTYANKEDAESGSGYSVHYIKRVMGGGTVPGIWEARRQKLVSDY